MGKISLAVASMLVACALAAPAGAYTNEKEHYSISLPQGWTNVGSVMGAVMFMSPILGDNPATLTIMVTSMPRSATIESCAETVALVLEQMENCTVESESYRTIGGLRGYEIVYSVDSNGSVLKSKQVVVLRNSKMYMLMFMSNEEGYRDCISQVDTSIDSFRVIGDKRAGAAVSPLLVAGGVIAFAAMAAGLGAWLRRRSRARRAARPVAPACPPGTACPQVPMQYLPVTGYQQPPPQYPQALAYQQPPGQYPRYPTHQQPPSPGPPSLSYQQPPGQYPPYPTHQQPPSQDSRPPAFQQPPWQ